MRTVLGRGFFGLVAVGVAVAALGQNTVSVTTPLLPQHFGQWSISPGNAAGGTSPVSLVNANKDALEECQPQRSQVAVYVDGGKTLHVEAVEFADRTGAFSAYTVVKANGMAPVKGLGLSAVTGDGAVLFTVGDSIAEAYPATMDDIAMLKPLAEEMPKAFGNKGVAPLLPSLLPAAGLERGSVRYALGPASYAAEGGVLPAVALGWDKDAEAVTALYKDERGAETLTMLLYPTPEIAGRYTGVVQGLVAGAGTQLANARVRRQGELVLLASGTFAGDQAQKMIENIHLKQILSIDQDVQPTFHMQVVGVYSLLTNIAILSGILMSAAVLLGLFLGGGRALYRVMQGKPAATEPEFLSLHLSPQNKAARFDP
jgi:hypothetical protein